MTSRPLPHLLPLVLLTATASLAATAAQAQTLPAVAAQGPALPTLTYTQTGAGTTTLIGTAADYRNYTFNITGFSHVGSDPNNAYTIFSFSNSSVESSPNFYGLSSFDLPPGWTFSTASDFVVSTDARGIHATDPSFGLTIFQKAGTAAIDPNGTPFTLYHQVNGVDPFTNPDGTPLIITAQAVPEASSVVSLGLLLLGGLAWKARRLTRQRV